MRAPLILEAASILFAYLLLVQMGNAVCQMLLRNTGLQKARDALLAQSQLNGTSSEASPKGVGAWIGTFERLIVAAGILIGAWEILVAVIALKTVSRFKEIDKQIHAEYFLVGSLFSLIWTFAVTLLWRFYDVNWGLNLTELFLSTASK